MQEPKEIIIDSCVFFKMIQFNDRFQEDGMKGVTDLVAYWEKFANGRLRNVLEIIPEEYKTEHKKLSTDQLIEDYKNHLTNEMSRHVNEIKKTITDMVGCYHRNKNDRPDNKHMDARAPEAIKADYEGVKSGCSFLVGKEFKKMFDEIEKSYGDFTQLKDMKTIKCENYKNKTGNDMIEAYKEVIEDEYNKFLQLKKEYESYITRKEIYKTASDTYEVGKLFVAAKNGEYSLNVVSVGLDEIMNHVAESHPKGAPEDFLTFSRDQIASMAQNCTLISINNEHLKNEDFIEFVDSLAQLLRTADAGDKKSKPMAQDINSVHQYGDSTIAALSLLIGYVLITQNGKDFIGDKKDLDFKIREHIKKYADQLSGALPYTVRELLEGKVDFKTRLPEGVSLVTVDAKDKKSMFAEEKELGWA